MSNFTDFFPAAVGGGAIPETAIFPNSGSYTWVVPQSVRDEIASEGHAEVGLLMVGAGTSTKCGEIINELYSLTTADYDDPSAASPTITVFVGSNGGPSGITSAPPATPTSSIAIPNQSGNNGWTNFAQNQVTLTLTPPNSPSIDSNGKAITLSLQLWTMTGNNNTAALVYDQITWDGSVAFDSTSAEQSVGNFYWNTAQSFDGTLGWRMYSSNYGTSVYSRQTLTFNTATGLFEFRGTGSYSSIGSLSINSATNIIYNNANAAATFARGAGSTDNFRNNASSTDGYFGGFCRINGSYFGSGGTTPQNGYVQIFHS